MLHPDNILSLMPGRRIQYPILARNDVMQPYISIGEDKGLAFSYACIPAGAVLLTRVFKGVGATAISVAQSVKFSNPYISLWSHVGIMGKDHRVWDIMPSKHVRCLDLSQFLVGVDFLAARVFEGAPINEDELDIHLREQSLAEYPSFTDPEFIRRAIQRAVLRRADLDLFDPNELICSTFVDRVLDMTLDTEPLPDLRPYLVWPAHFAASKAYRDVPLNDFVFRVI